MQLLLVLLCQLRFVFLYLSLKTMLPFLKFILSQRSLLLQLNHLLYKSKLLPYLFLRSPYLLTILLYLYHCLMKLDINVVYDLVSYQSKLKPSLWLDRFHLLLQLSNLQPFLLKEGSIRQLNLNSFLRCYQWRLLSRYFDYQALLEGIKSGWLHMVYKVVLDTLCTPTLLAYLAYYASH